MFVCAFLLATFRVLCYHVVKLCCKLNCLILCLYCLISNKLLTYVSLTCEGTLGNRLQQVYETQTVKSRIL